MSTIRRLFATLTSVSSGSALHVVKITLPPPPGGQNSYLVDRSGLLDILLGADMLAVLDRYSLLTELHFFLIDSDARYDEAWWEEEMVCRLPSRLHAAVSVTIYQQHLGFDLWLPEDEITDENAEQDKVETTEEEAEDIVTNDLAISSSVSHSQLDIVVNYGGVRRKILDAGGYVA
ncbi:hypothetical protein C8Q74DRAFT_1364055 [Fomes fomentarius]|nr:hypothetical protein C8Q74DRAFT_1364055 [Fomes fomentarius]